VLSGRGLCDELITRPEEFYRLCCVVVCDLETSRMGAPYIYDISHLRVNNANTNSKCDRRRDPQAAASPCFITLCIDTIFQTSFFISKWRLPNFPI